MTNVSFFSQCVIPKRLGGSANKLMLLFLRYEKNKGQSQGAIKRTPAVSILLHYFMYFIIIYVLLGPPFRHSKKEGF